MAETKVRLAMGLSALALAAAIGWGWFGLEGACRRSGGDWMRWREECRVGRLVYSGVHEASKRGLDEVRQQLHLFRLQAFEWSVMYKEADGLPVYARLGARFGGISVSVSKARGGGLVASGMVDGEGRVCVIRGEVACYFY